MFRVSGSPLLAMRPGDDEKMEDAGPLLQAQLLLLEDTAKTAVEGVCEYLKNSVSMAETSVARLTDDIHRDEEWERYSENFDEMQAACLKCAEKIAALKNLALAIKDATFNGLYGTRLPNGEMTDPIMEAWDNFRDLLHR